MHKFATQLQVCYVYCANTKCSKLCDYNENNATYIQYYWNTYLYKLLILTCRLKLFQINQIWRFEHQKRASTPSSSSTCSSCCTEQVDWDDYHRKPKSWSIAEVERRAYNLVVLIQIYTLYWLFARFFSFLFNT